MPEGQYSSVVFPLMFWKYLSDTWEHHHQEFLADNDGLDGLSAEEAREIEYRDYQSFEIPFIYPGTIRGRRASWTSILATITQPGLGQRVRASLQAIETANPDKFSRLFGSMTWTSEEVLPGEVLAAVMQAIDRVPKMHEGSMSHDVLGGAYEYLLKRFSDGSGRDYRELRRPQPTRSTSRYIIENNATVLSIKKRPAEELHVSRTSSIALHPSRAEVRGGRG
jgi:type I restriction enzyme M protein